MEYTVHNGNIDSIAPMLESKLLNHTAVGIFNVLCEHLTKYRLS